MEYYTPDEAVTHIKEKVRILHGDAVGDEVLEIYIRRFVNNVLVYCHRDDFPELLVLTITDLVGKRLEGESDNSVVGLKALTQDDTKFEFATDGYTAVGTMADADFATIYSQLNAFRKLARHAQ